MNARCEVENTMVELDLPRMRGSMLFPSCVRLQRCRGCCVGELIECQPTIYKPVTLQVANYMITINMYFDTKYIFSNSKHAE